MKMVGNLEGIGFYTLSDKRAEELSLSSPLYRCEMILTDRCNFKCPYCRGLRDDLKGDIDYNQATKTIKLWSKEGLKNIRFSGGEPTLYKKLNDLVKLCKDQGIERIAISTNGSASLNLYNSLVENGVNDFSISLDACCSSTGDIMTGVKNKWNKVIENIKELSKKTYVTVGMVFTEQNINKCIESILFARSLGVSDVRVIPSAQYNKALNKLSYLPDILNKYPILKYRVNNVKNNRHVRGILKEDTNKCYIVLDDMAASQDKHFPCIIYLREKGNPIGKIGPNMRRERYEWFKNHNTKKDIICKENCLECLCHHNNTVEKFIDARNNIQEKPLWIF